MEIQTLDDVQAWVDRMWGLGRVDGPYEPQELRQVLQVLMQDVMRLKEERAQFTAWHAAQRAQFQAAAAALEAQMAALKVTKLDKAEFEKFVATVMAEYTTLQAAYETLLDAEDDLDIFQAGYERGYALGWEHAQQAADPAGPA